MTRWIRPASAGFLLLLLAAAAGTAAAAPGPGAKCTAPKARAAGRGVAGRLRCLGKVASTGRPLDAACVAAANAKVASGVDKADRHGPCAGTTAALVAHIDDCATQIAAQLPDPGACSAAKYKAAGRKASDKLACDARVATTGIPAPGCLAIAEAKFNAALVKAESHGPCAGTAPAVEAAVDDCRTPLRVDLGLETTTTTTVSTTTSTIPTPGCGNAIVEAGEECDGQPFCTPACHIQAGYCCDAFLGAPVCADVGTILDSTCFFTCVQSGGHCSFGTCVGTACTDVPYPPTSICCDGALGCAAAVVSGSAGLAQFIHDCGYVHSFLDLTVGTCGPDSHCVPGG
jgi:cytochrome c556